MGSIVSLTREKCVIGKLADEAGGIIEIEAPMTFVVGQVPTVGAIVGPDDPAVSEIKYNALGNVWLRRPHFEVLFADSNVKRIIPDDEVVDLAVDMTNPEKKKKKKALAADNVPDLSAAEGS